MTIGPDDKLQIHELGAKFYVYLDAENPAGVAALFSDDGVFVAPYGEFTGPQAVQGFLESHVAAGKEDGVKHFITNLVVEATAEGARLTFYILKMGVVTGPTLIATASGDCTVQKVGDDWRFTRFELAIDPAMFANKN